MEAFCCRGLKFNFQRFWLLFLNGFYLFGGRRQYQQHLNKGWRLYLVYNMLCLGLRLYQQSSILSMVTKGLGIDLQFGRWLVFYLRSMLGRYSVLLRRLGLV